MTLAVMRRCNAYTSYVTPSLLHQQSLGAQLVRRLSRRQLQALIEALAADRRPGSAATPMADAAAAPG